MTRNAMIDAVLVKLEEYSPFSAPDNFTADSDMNGVIQPVRSYVEATLNAAIYEAVGMLPLRLLAQDIIQNRSAAADVDTDGVGRIYLGTMQRADIIRIAEVRFQSWERGARPIDKTSQEYALQCNPYTRGGSCKPVVVWDRDNGQDILECYSLEKRSANYTEKPTRLSYIEQKGYLNTQRACDYAVLLCAIKVHDIYGNGTQAKAMSEELAQMLQVDNINL